MRQHRARFTEYFHQCENLSNKFESFVDYNLSGTISIRCRQIRTRFYETNYLWNNVGNWFHCSLREWNFAEFIGEYCLFELNKLFADSGGYYLITICIYHHVTYIS